MLTSIGDCLVMLTSIGDCLVMLTSIGDCLVMLTSIGDCLVMLTSIGDCLVPVILTCIGDQGWAAYQGGSVSTYPILIEGNIPISIRTRY